MKRWNYRAFGTETDPVRQSAMMDFASQDGCAKRYRYMRDEQANGIARERGSVHWRPAIGTAVHGTINRALSNPEICSRVLDGRFPPRATVDRVIAEELLKAAEGLPIDWRDDSEAVELANARVMVDGALRTVSERAARILFTEAPFRVVLDGFVLEGTIDLAFERREGGIGLVDWKTGARAMPAVILQHGYQPAIYARALQDGVLWPGTERETRLNTHPDQIWIVQLREYAELERKRAIIDELRACGGATSADLSVILAQRGWPLSASSVSGALGALRKESLVDNKRLGKKSIWTAVDTQRGPSEAEVWHESPRRPSDVQRLKVSLAVVVGTARMGRFVEALGEHCGRCPYKGQCLTEGHAPTREEARVIERELEGIEYDGFSEAV